MRKENGKISKSKALENAIIVAIPTIKLVGIGFVVYSMAV